MHNSLHQYTGLHHPWRPTHCSANEAYIVPLWRCKGETKEYDEWKLQELANSDSWGNSWFELSDNGGWGEWTHDTWGLFNLAVASLFRRDSKQLEQTLQTIRADWTFRNNGIFEPFYR